MRLFEALETESRGTIRVGTRGGTGFVYIGDKENVPECYISRKVVETYSGLTEDRAVYIVTGHENGTDDYNGAPDYGSRRIDPFAYINLAEAIYSDALRELAIYYGRLLCAKTVKDALLYSRKAIDVEEWLRADVYGIYDGGADGVIDTARRLAELEAEGGVLSMPTIDELRQLQALPL